MRLWIRVAWLLLGLLVVAGAVHAPLHDAGSDCGPWSLCSGAVVLMLVAATLVLAALRLAERRHGRPVLLLLRQQVLHELRLRGPPRG